LLEGKRLRLLYFFTSTGFILFSLFYNGYSLYFSDFLYQYTTRVAASLAFLTQFAILIFGRRFLQVETSFNWLRWVWRFSLAFTAMQFVGCVMVDSYD